LCFCELTCKEKDHEKVIPLGIPAFYDRLVQEAVSTIFQIIYEPIFSNHSHGFRPGRDCHSALRHIRKGSKGFSWAIEGDIKVFFTKVFCFFYNIDHSVLLNILNTKIKDSSFIGLINALLKVIVPEEAKAKDKGSILTPFYLIYCYTSLTCLWKTISMNSTKVRLEKTNTEYRHRRAFRKYGAKATSKVEYSYAS
jgi:hypothetical protein